jgi:hypothetical protein
MNGELGASEGGFSILLRTKEIERSDYELLKHLLMVILLLVGSYATLHDIGSEPARVVALDGLIEDGKTITIKPPIVIGLLRVMLIE